MTFTLAFLPEVENDVVTGYAWYEDKAAGLGEEFLRLFYAYSKEIIMNPVIYSRVHKDFRRRLLRRFPYAIYFKIENDRVIVFGLFHCARDPKLIRQSLGQRRTSRDVPSSLIEENQ